MTDKPSASSDRPARVLLVEDQEELARNLEELLRLDGFDVMWTGSGARAVDMARRWHFDAVVLDVVLPGPMDGLEVCRVLRSDPATDRVVVIMITGVDEAGARMAGLQGGADDYLVKPIVRRELVVRLRQLLDDRRSRIVEVREQRRAAIDQMAAAVGHEINNPLAAALGRLDLLLLSPDLPAGIRNELVACQQHLLRIQRIVARLDVGVEDRTVPYVGSDKMIDLDQRNL